MPQSIQVSTRPAVNIGEIHVTVFRGTNTQGGLKLVIARRARVAQEKHRLVSGRALAARGKHIGRQALRVNYEFVVRTAWKKTQAQDNVRSNFAVNFDVPRQVVRRAGQTILRRGYASSFVVDFDVGVAERQRRANRDAILVEEACDTRGVIDEVAGQ